MAQEPITFSADDVKPITFGADDVATTPNPSSNAPDPFRPVTLGDIEKNPREAFARIGALIKRDVSDPKMWMSAAAMYFGPKVIDAIGPAVADQAGSMGTAMAKKIGIDPAAMEKQIATMDLQATRMRLQAARSRTRQAQMAQDLADAASPQAQAAKAAQQSSNAIINYGRASGVQVDPSHLIPGGVEADPAALDNYARAQGVKVLRLYGPSGEQVVGPASAPQPITRPATDQISAPVAAPLLRLPVATDPAVTVLEGLKQGGASANELLQAGTWLKQGMPGQAVVSRLNAARTLAKTAP